MQKVGLLKKKFPLSMLFLIFLFGNWMVYGQSTPRLGDVNNDDSVNIVDALMIAQYYVGNTPPGFIYSAADVDLSGQVSIVDALIVAQYYVGLIPALPPGSTPTAIPSRTITPTPTATPTDTSQPVPTFDNPFANARWYVNPDWADLARKSGGAAVENNNTAIWLDKVAAINAGRGLRGHLDTALSQGANLVQLVIYNLPNRNCMQKSSKSEFQVAQDGINRYKTEFIDPVAAILANPAYKNLRIVAIIEPESFPNLISGRSTQYCSEVGTSGAYTLGIQYALNSFNKIPNVYCYMDAAYASWLGWDSNFEPGMDLAARILKGADKGVNSISGLITNVANYDPLEEPFLPDDNLQIAGNPVRASAFFDYNPVLSEKEYALAVRNAIISRGFPAAIGMLIDTSRNGWGGPDRPVAVSTSNVLNTYVNESRIDRRLHRNNWCNQPGGIGERPQADPAPGIDAYVWAWPPGVSDGASSAANLDPLDTTEQFEQMCDPAAKSVYNPDYGTGALAAPHKWGWNQSHFELLLRNIYPQL